MRIAMISEHSGAGGRHVNDLSAALVRAGHDVTVYRRKNARGLLAEEVAPEGYRLVHVPVGPAKRLAEDEILPHIARFTRFVARHWRENPPEVVHSHFWLWGLAGVFATRGQQIPTVHTFHSLGTVKRRHEGAVVAERVQMERLVGRSVTRLVATCSDEVAELRRMGIRPERVTVIPPGVDCGRFRPEGPAEPAKRLPHRVVTVGGPTPASGLGDLVAALRGSPDAELVIVGDAGSDVSTLATDLGVTDRVRFAGQVPRDRMPALLRSADLVACAPWYEASGQEPIEAMACGVPVLATAVGGLTDTVVDGVTGALVPPRRPGALATAMRTLLADPLKREFLGATGRDRAESRYPWDRIAADTTRVYTGCAAPADTLVISGT